MWHVKITELLIQMSHNRALPKVMHTVKICTYMIYTDVSRRPISMTVLLYTPHLQSGRYVRRMQCCADHHNVMPVCSTVWQLCRCRSRSHFAARCAAVVSARRHLEQLRFTASIRSAVPVELSTRSPSRNCADRSMLNSLTQIQRRDAAHDARRLMYNCSVLVDKAGAVILSNAAHVSQKSTVHHPPLP